MGERRLVLNQSTSRGEANRNNSWRLIAKDASDRESVVAIIVVRRVDAARIRVEVVAMVAAVKRRGPEVAVRALVVRRGRVVVPGERKGQSRRLTRAYKYLDTK